MVGLDTPIVPQRGQVLVTERAEPLLNMALGSVRQTDEGTVQIGNTEEDVEFDDGTTLSAGQAMARHAVQVFPQLAGLRLIRTWGCIRVLTPDKCAIYDRSEEFPGAMSRPRTAASPSPPSTARHTAKWIATGETPPGFEEFSAKRFRQRADMFRRTTEIKGETVAIRFDGQRIVVPAETVAAAVLANSPGHTRTSVVSGEARAPYCLMGTCFECLMEIDGIANRQAAARLSPKA